MNSHPVVFFEQECHQNARCSTDNQDAYGQVLIANGSFDPERHRRANEQADRPHDMDYANIAVATHFITDSLQTCFLSVTFKR